MNWLKNCKCGDPDLGLLIVRLVLAAVFIAHGWQKFQNIDGTISFFGNLGLAPFFAYLVAAVEFFGGLAMLLGVYTHWAGKLLAVVMIVAIFLVKYKMGLLGGYELDLSLLANALAITMLGPGKYTVEKLLK